MLWELLRKSIQPLVGILKRENTQKFPTKKNKDRKEVPPEKKQDPGIGKKSGKHDESWNSESS